MKKLKKADIIIMICILALIVGIILVKCIFNAKDSDGSGKTASADAVSEMKEFNGRKSGIKTGSSFEEPTMKYFPDSEYSYFDSDTDMIMALQTGKIDSYMQDEPVAKMICKENHNLAYFRTAVEADDYHFGFQKQTERSKILIKQFNDMVKDMWSSGEMDKLIAKWTEGSEEQKVVDESGLNGENGVLLVAILADFPPFSYYRNGELTGYVIELCTLFGRKYGYTIKYEDVKSSSGVAGLASEKYDILGTALSYTEERAKSIDFSDVIYKGGMMLMVRASDVTGPDIISFGNGSPEVNEPDYAEYDGKKIGILTGSSFEDVTLEKFPNSEYIYFENNSDLILALEQHKIDAFVEDEPVAKMINIEKPEINYLKKLLVSDDYSLGFQKDTATSRVYRGQFNEMLKELWANGEIDRLIKKWFEGDESEKTIDRSGLTGENGQLVIAARSNKPPFSYYENGEFTGYGVELVTMFAKRYGYSLKFEDTNLSAMLAGLTAEKYDIGISSMSVTEERKKSIDFSDTFYNGGMVLVIRSEDIRSDGSSATAQNTGESKGFFESVKDSFEKNFITEDRWKLILEGIGITCAITLLTVLFGSILAFAICMFRRVDSSLAGAICNLYVKLLQGTPMVVLLMILYYVVFGKSGIDAMWVAVIGFSLNFGAYGSEIMRSGIESIDSGQREAALALGFTENQGFFRFIFPQAAVRFLPVYRGEIISLLKNTSIVGYIAIQDLTKMSDIIRSRTFEAFFPLIATAVIYFILAWFISLILAKILKVVDPKQKKKKAMKGVTVK